MGAKVCDLNRVAELLGQWADSRTVVVPGAPPENSGFVPFDGKWNALLPGTTVRSVKDLLFAQSDMLFGYELEDGAVKFTEAAVPEEVVAVGVRPCDARAITMLDPVFCEDPDLYDPAYQARRDRTTLVVIGCNVVGSGCFCTGIGGDPHGKQGADLFITELEDRLLLEAVTDKGEALLSAAVLTDASAEDMEQSKVVTGTAREMIELPIEGLKEKLDNMFDHDIWSQLHETCLGCGVCTYLCPTCHCFDVTDERRGEAYQRLRTWDSCQFTLFTLHGSGHNPRPTTQERLRQRFMHKLNYYPDKHGVSACVGCGRCVNNCPVNIDIREIIRQIGGVTA